MFTPHSAICNLQSGRRGFTLTELLVVMLILSILAGLALAGLSGAVNDARASRTKTVINKVDLLISERWEGFRTRAVPVRVNPALLVAVKAQPSAFWTARIRLYALRELMRMELPDRITDVTDDPVIPGVTVPSLTQSYRRLALRATGGTIANWTSQHQGSECLYLILSTMKDGDKSALDYFSTDEIGDIDGDGMKEILDGWGQPIEFLRWAPGYAQHPGQNGVWGKLGDDDNNGTPEDIFEAGWPDSDDVADSPVTPQTRIGTKHPTLTGIPFAPDPYDPLRIDPRVCLVNMNWTAPPPPPVITLGSYFPPTPADTNGASNDTYALKPLIFSAGLDKSYDVNIEGGLVYRLTVPPNDPFYADSMTGRQAGNVGDADGDGYAHGWADNITNHDNTAQ